MFENKERIATGLIMIAGFLVIGFLDYYPIIWVAFGAVFLFSFQEALKLYNIDDDNLIWYAGAMWVVTLFFNHPEMVSLIILVVFGSLYAYNAEKYKNIIPIFIYPTIPVFFLLGLYTEFGMGSIFWIVAIVAGTDTGAYFTGKAIGKTPFSEVSPNKTMEGVIGGILIGTTLGTIVGLYTIDFILAITVSLFSAVASVFGDLYESYLKRQAEVKDSGNLFPGHGGMLDRTDGYMFAGVIMFAILQGLS